MRKNLRTWVQIPPSPHIYKKNIKNKPVNNQIKAGKVRLVDEKGEQLGVFNLDEALRKSKERGLDLIQLTNKSEPSVCRMMDYGKYLYSLKKKEKKQKNKSSEVKGARLSLGISDHDMETKANLCKKFLGKGNRVKIEMRLRGREKAHKDLATEKIEKFIEIIGKEIPVKKEGNVKKQPRGLILMISKK